MESQEQFWVSQVCRYQVPFLKSLVWPNLGLNHGLPDHCTQWLLMELEQSAGAIEYSDHISAEG